jgi:hypothetical protein
MPTANPNDILQPLQLFGDYIRLGKHPAPEHPLMRKLAGHIPNQNIFNMLVQEGHKRLEMMLGMYHGQLNDRKIWQPYEDHRYILPEFDRMHSVLHGMTAWYRTNPTYEPASGNRLEQLGRLDRHLLTQFDLGGLTYQIAEDILVMAGRELVDPHILCHSTLPREVRLSQSAVSTPKTPDQIPSCLMAC